MHKPLKYWTQISFSGVERADSDWEKRKFILINQYNMIALFGLFTFLVLNLFLGYYILAFSDLAGMAICWWGITINKKKSDWAVDLPFLVISLNIILGHIVYGIESLCFLITLPLFMGLLIAHQLRNTRKVVLLSCFPLALFALDAFGFFEVEPFPALPAPILEFIRFQSLTFTFACTSVFFYLLMQSHIKVSEVVKDQERALKDILSSTSEMIWGIDPDYQLTYFNEAFRKSFKVAYASEPEPGLSLKSFFTREDDSFWKDFYDNALSGKEVLFERKIKGQVLQIALHPVMQDNRIKGVACIGRDISSSFSWDQPSLDLSESASALVFQGISYPDLSGEITYVNAWCEDIFGVKASAVIRGEFRFSDVLFSDEKALFITKYRKALKDAIAFNENFRINVEGTIKTINIKAFPEEAPSGDHIKWHGVINDITNSLFLSRENQDLKELLFSLNRNLSEAIFRSSEAGGLIFANDAYLKLFGFKDMAEAKRQNSALPNVNTEVRQKLFEKLKTKGYFENEEALFHCSDGSTFYGLVSAYIASYQNDKAIVDGSIRDITKIKEVEKELRKAKIKADKANKAKTDFLSTMSHEIRTPLNAIIGVSQILSNQDLPQKIEDNISVIHNSGNILLNLINDILDFSKIESGHLQLEEVDFDLTHLIKDIHKTLGFLRGSKNIELEYTIDPDLRNQYRGDPGRLSQILLNLANNAVKFTSEGKVSIKATLVNTRENQDLIELTVEDTGIGIPKNVQKQIFKSFTQAEAGTTRKYGGTGLGLSIVKKLTRLFDGSVHLESTPGEGSVFTVKLALQHAEEKSAGVITAHGDKDLSGYSLLLAEDNQVNAAVAKQLLHQWGAKVQTAENGKEVLEALREGNYDLLLLDLHMPVMDGFETIEKIRQNPDWEDLPVLALTADTLDNIIERVKEAGMNGFVSKPFQQDDLYQKIVDLSSVHIS